jgi:hypothetical protein
MSSVSLTEQRGMKTTIAELKITLFSEQQKADEAKRNVDEAKIWTKQKLLLVAKF